MNSHGWRMFETTEFWQEIDSFDNRDEIEWKLEVSSWVWFGVPDSWNFHSVFELSEQSFVKLRAWSLNGSEL